MSPGPIGSERPRPPGRWTQLDPGGGRRRRGQSRGSGGGGARGLEAEPRAVSPAPAAAATAAAAATVLCLLWPWWLPALPLAARRPGIPSRLPSRWPGAQVRLAALPRPRVLLGIVQSRGRPLRAVSAPLLPSLPGGGPGGRDDSIPIPPPHHHFQAPRLSSGSRGQASSFPRGCGPTSPLTPPAPITQSLGLEAGVPFRASVPHLFSRRAPRQRAEILRDSGAGKVSLVIWVC